MSVYKQIKEMIEEVIEMEQDENGECEVVREMYGHKVCYLEQFGDAFWSIDHNSVSEDEVMSELILAKVFQEEQEVA